MKRIAALPAAEQVEEVRKELRNRNPEFDGMVEHKIEDGVVTEIRVMTDKVTDIAPIRVFNALRALDLSGIEGEGQPTDLTSLKGLNFTSLTRLDLSHTKIDDAGLTYLVGLDMLTELIIGKTKVTAKGLGELAKALPKCKITWDGGVIEPK